MTLFPRIVSLPRASRAWATCSCSAAASSPTTRSPALREAGVAAVFTPGAPLADIVDWLEPTLDAREAQKAS